LEIEAPVVAGVSPAEVQGIAADTAASKEDLKRVAGCRRVRRKELSPAQMLIEWPAIRERTGEYICDGNCELFVLLHKASVRIHLKL
jgi:hypothetical protein